VPLCTAADPCHYAAAKRWSERVVDYITVAAAEAEATAWRGVRQQKEKNLMPEGLNRNGGAAGKLAAPLFMRRPL